MAQDLNHFAFGRGTPFRVRYNFHNNLLPGYSSHESMLRYENIPTDTLIIRQHESIALLILECAHDLRNRTGYHLNDFTFNSAPALAPGSNSH
ncbi:hypothetical protein D3C73_577490 [compost metagenome]